MRTIGLIGGMSFESSAVYYRIINEAVRDRLGALHSAEIILHSVDFQELVDMQKTDRWLDAGQRLASVAQRLEQAGADCILICTNTMHLVADTVEQAIQVPLINIIDETARALRQAGRKRPLLLGTRYTMEHGFYAKRIETHGLELLVPDETDRTAIHSIIFNELCSGIILPASRAALIAIIEKAKLASADAVIFGCTELGLILNTDALPVPGFDSAAIHCAAAVSFSLADEESRNTTINAFDDGAKAADAVSQSTARQSNATSSQFYKRLAKRLRAQMD